MSNEQLYLAIVVPLVVNGFMFIAFAASLIRQIDQMGDLLRSDLRGIEDRLKIVDARLKGEKGSI